MKKFIFQNITKYSINAVSFQCGQTFFELGFYKNCSNLSCFKILVQKYGIYMISNYLSNTFFLHKLCSNIGIKALKYIIELFPNYVFNYNESFLLLPLKTLKYLNHIQKLKFTQ